MKTSTMKILTVLHVLSWIIFIGVCIEAGTFIFSAFSTMLLNPEGAKHLYHQVDLSALYYYDRGYFLIETILMSIVAILRAIIFYLIIQLLYEKKLDMSKPFSPALGRFTIRIAYLSLLTGLFSFWGAKYAAWFVMQGVQMPDVEYLRLGGADVWLFMGVTLFVIAQVFKRGIEIQSENELTV